MNKSNNDTHKTRKKIPEVMNIYPTIGLRPELHMEQIGDKLYFRISSYTDTVAIRLGEEEAKMVAARIAKYLREIK